MALEYLLFNEGQSGAFVTSSSVRRTGLTFQDEFFTYGSLRLRTPEEAEAESQRQGFHAYETTAELTDKNKAITRINYDAGKLVGIDTKINLVSINPKRAFNFWLALSKALREHLETPERIKQGLERIAHITSVDLQLIRHLNSMPEDLGQNYLKKVYGPDVARDYA